MTAYPEDVTKALAYAADAGWTTERYQAVLAIALAHLDGFVPEPVELEVVVMFAEPGDQIVATVKRYGHTPDGYGYMDREVEVPAGYYLVCPHCLSLTEPYQVDRVTEGRKTYWDECADGGLLMASVGEGVDGQAEAWWFECDHCAGRLFLPEWVEVEYV